MELRIDMDYNQILGLIHQLPLEEREKLVNAIKSEIVLGNKICNIRDRNFSTMVGELIKEEAIRNELPLKKNATAGNHVPQM